MPNGLEVILREDHRVAVAAVNLWYHVGSANDERDSTGLAHLFEHMMLQGSGHAPGDVIQRLQAVGATAVNAHTDLDRTAYLADVPSNQLELALWLESDRMGYLPDALDETTLLNQQAVARNERRQNIENAPYGLAQEEMYRLLFPEDHPYHSSVLGSHEDIQTARLSDIRRFHKRFYVPNNASLAIVGDIDIPATKKLVDKYFRAIPRGPEAPEVRASRAALKSERRKTLTDRVELPRVLLAWHSDAAFSKEDAVAVVTSRLLGEGKASRLFESLVYDRQIAQTASSRHRSLAHGSVFWVTATAKPGRNPAELESAVIRELKRLAAEGPGRGELLAAKTALHAIAVKSLEPFGAVADRLNAYNHYVGDPGFLNRDLQRYAAVSGTDVKRFVGERLLAEPKVVVQVRPGEKVLPPEPAVPPPGPATAPLRSKIESWRNEVPSAPPPRTARLPSIEGSVLNNGLRIFVSRADTLPLVTARLVALGGTASDPPELPGLTDFTAAMLNEGAGRRRALDIANALTALGSTLDTGTSTETSWVSVQALKPQLRKTMEIMSDVVLRPRFSPDELDRLRDDRLVALRQQRDDPMTTAARVMRRELYGSDHPYGHLALGTERSVLNTEVGDLRRTLRRVFGPQNAALLLTGDISMREARDLASDLFGKWSGDALRPPPPPGPNPGRDRVLIVDKPGSPQTSVMLAQTGVPRADPEFSNLAVMNKTLGGLFSSRLNTSLRETLGLTYGVSSSVSEKRGPGLISISTSVDGRHLRQALEATLFQVRRMKDEGVTPQELAEARDSIIHSLAGLFATNTSTAGTIADLFALDLPLDLYLRLPSRLQAIGAADVTASARRHLRPEQMKIVLVGDRRQIEPQLESMDLGPVGYRTAGEDS